MHFCLNAVTGRREVGSAVLLRAGEPVAGEAAMRRRRGLLDRPRPVRPGDVAGGPGKLCQALGIDRDPGRGPSLPRPPQDRRG